MKPTTKEFPVPDGDGEPGGRQVGLSRRNLLVGAGALTGAAALGAGWFARRAAAADTDIHVELTARAGTVVLWPGASTRVWRYVGRLLAGPPGALVPVGDSYLGPTFHVRRGQRVRIDFRNELDQPTNVHWHGLDTPPDMDGHPRDVVPPGATRRYEFTVRNPAGTYWYHPHPMGATATQVYAGLAGLFVVSDSEEGAVALPTGDRDIPLVLQDRLAADRQFMYPGGDDREGALGNWLLVNGSLEREATVEAAPYRIRILNGSNARIYQLGWSDGSPMTVIGTDGGLLTGPSERDAVLLAPGERIEVWADFARWSGGDVWLESRAFREGHGMGGHGMGGHGMGDQAAIVPPNGAPFPIRHFVVRGHGAPSSAPARLLPGSTHRLDGVPARLRTFTLGLQGGRWLINGREFVLDEVLPEEVVPFGAVEDWEFRSGHMMPVPHPMHVHGPRFRVLERSGGMHAGRRAAEGYVDEGWKDTFLMMPGESVRIRIKFEHYRGLYVLHCHNLEHEEMGMMRNYLVR
jgi:FtsP/CotA-like multicopper oxidase with cupredoxin domain